MSREPSKPLLRTESLTKSVRARRATGLGIFRAGPLGKAIEALASPSLGLGLLIAVIFAVCVTALLLWTRVQPLVAVGRVMDETRLVRLGIEIEDREATDQNREAARQATPRVYVADAPVIDALITSVENLPRALSAAERLEDVDQAIRDQFALTPAALDVLRREVVEGQPSDRWLSQVATLRHALESRPFLDAQTWQRNTQEGLSKTVRLVIGGETRFSVNRDAAVNIEDRPQFEAAVRELVSRARFDEPVRPAVMARLMHQAKPTYRFDAAATTADQNAAAEGVLPVVRRSPAGQVIYERGQVLTQAAADLFEAELARYEEDEVSRAQRWIRVVGVAGASAGLTLALAGYTILFCPRARRNASRMGGVALILLLALAAACFTTAAAPQFAAVTTLAPTLLVALLISIGYDRRSALAYALLHAILVCLATRESVGMLATSVTGIACVVWSLKEVRDRNSLVRTSVITAIGVGLATALFAFVDRPLFGDPTLPNVLRETAVDSGLAGAGALVVGAVVLFTLPLIERAFNVTTGMTLVELRDPKQPLLRELQVRAPGTYNHSLNVAAIAEAAADAIGADGLLAFVGALYHDVGKMNKPEYFVENQVGGANKHDKLTPAMSLLIVVGHVKDGVELAREFRLPQPLQHFIEAHHGTTLVEFFYHRARQLALGTGRGKDSEELDEGYVPDEFEYRYPGPKPRTREVAILMIADAVESATRAMAEPSPSKIDALVRSIAHKRLLDGQFDDCELTLRDLNAIVESVARTVTSMYHGRVHYPSGETESSDEGTAERRA